MGFETQNLVGLLVHCEAICEELLRLPAEFTTNIMAKSECCIMTLDGSTQHIKIKPLKLTKSIGKYPSWKPSNFSVKISQPFMGPECSLLST